MVIAIQEIVEKNIAERALDTGFKPGPVRTTHIDNMNMVPPERGKPLCMLMEELARLCTIVAVEMEQELGSETDRSLPNKRARMDHNRTGPAPEKQQGGHRLDF